jgi:hypothetical protein
VSVLNPVRQGATGPEGPPGPGAPLGAKKRFQHAEWNGTEWVAAAAPEAIDICAEFGVSTALLDNSAIINEAIKLLGEAGLRGVIGTPGAYAIQNPVVIGDGNPATEKAASFAGELCGAGNPGWLGQFASARTQLSWTGAAGVAAMVEVLGPVSGWGLKRLLLHGRGLAKSPLRVSAGQFGQVEDVYTLETLTGIICRSVTPFGGKVTNTMHNFWRRLGINFLGFPGGEPSARNAGILLTSEGRNDANCSFEDWLDIWINVPATAVGNGLSAIHLGGVDTAWFRGIHPLYAAGSADSQFSITFDYGDGNTGWPESASIEAADLVKPPRNIGAPAVPGNTYPNLITLVSGANGGGVEDPHLQNLSWVDPRVMTIDRQQGQVGAISPSDAGWFTANQVMAANTAYASRFVPDRDMANPKFSFVVTTAATVNDKIEITVYDGGGNRIATSGEKEGLVNTTGIKTVQLVGLTLVRGQTYYIVISYGPVGGVAATIQSANFNATNVSGIFGGAPPAVRAMQKGASYPSPEKLNGIANAIGSMMAVTV